MRVLLVLLLNLILLLTLTIASVYLQQDQSSNEDCWVHVALMIVCLAQFTMTAVWAARPAEEAAPCQSERIRQERPHMDQAAKT
jgi:quinol-cytochrome oxidoreductase complex cytochrome b subunit